MKDKITTRDIVQWIFVGVFILGLIGCIIYIASFQLSSKESALLSIILTIISVIATWIVSNLFSESAHKSALAEVKEQHQTNLKTYALNAAEKVDNLSNELRKFSIYLQEELEKEDESLEEANMSKAERIESAIHIVNTLKSVNDTALSDWKGVIGDELDEIREERLDRENELRELVDRVEEVVNNQNSHLQNITSASKREQARQIEELRKELSLALNSVSGTVIKPTRKKNAREKVTNECPHCSSEINYTQRAKINSYKTVKCSNCDQRSLARWNQELNFHLIKEAILDEKINCPWCSQSTTIHLSNVPFSKKIEECEQCNEQIKATRKVDGISLTKFNQPAQATITREELTEEFIQKVKGRLPEQPWPTGIHKTIAEEFDSPNRHISWAIKELISRGDFNPQIDGVIYYRKEK